MFSVWSLVLYFLYNTSLLHSKTITLHWCQLVSVHISISCSTPFKSIKQVIQRLFSIVDMHSSTCEGISKFWVASIDSHPEARTITYTPSSHHHIVRIGLFGSWGGLTSMGYASSQEFCELVHFVCKSIFKKGNFEATTWPRMLAISWLQGSLGYFSHPVP